MGLYVLGLNLSMPIQLVIRYHRRHINLVSDRLHTKHANVYLVARRGRLHYGHEFYLFDQGVINSCCLDYNHLLNSKFLKHYGQRCFVLQISRLSQWLLTATLLFATILSVLRLECNILTCIIYISDAEERYHLYRNATKICFSKW